MATIYIKTLGCKVNNYDSQALSAQLADLGHTTTNIAEMADIMVLNTCSVTQHADREARYIIRKMHRARPDAVIIATGCYAQTNRDELASIAEVQLVVPGSQKSTLAATIHALYQNHQSGSHGHFCRESADAVAVTEPQQPLQLERINPQQTRVYIRIQDGCESFCSYCIIPKARGRLRSVSPQEIHNEVDRLQTLGIKEVVLTGIHLGNYGRDLTACHGQLEPLTTLTEVLVTKVMTQSRLRFSSLEPMELSPALMALAKKYPDRICPHFHLPLQSGSTRILKLMNRPYNAEQYLARIQSLYDHLPHVHITTDVIVGFPSETEEDFDATCAVLCAARLGKVHVFPYSPRQGTAAAEMKEQLDPALVASRATKLRELSSELEHKYVDSFIGKTLTVLWENSFDEKGRRIGRAENYLEVVCDDAGVAIRHQTTKVIIEALTTELILLGKTV